jgi:hypothetical protein
MGSANLAVSLQGLSKPLLFTMGGHVDRDLVQAGWYIRQMGNQSKSQPACCMSETDMVAVEGGMKPKRESECRSLSSCLQHPLQCQQQQQHHSIHQCLLEHTHARISFNNLLSIYIITLSVTSFVSQYMQPITAQLPLLYRPS